MVIISGLDLAGLPKRCSGYVSIDIGNMKIIDMLCLYGDEEIIMRIDMDRPAVLAIDAPLMEKPMVRDVDRIAMRHGYRVLPPTLGGMSILTRRAWNLYRVFKNIGIEVIETHPKSALRSSGFGNVVELANRLGIKVNRGSIVNKDVADALVCSIVAYCYYIKECIDVISGVDGKIYIVKNIGKH